MPDDSSDDVCPPALAERLRAPVPLDEGARERLAARLRAEPAPARGGALLRPVTFRLSPLGAGAIAASLVAMGVVGHAALDGLRAPVLAPATASEPATARAVVASGAARATFAANTGVRVVRFVLVAPEAGRVALVGDFNGWDARRTPLHATATPGVWTVELALPAGRHTYAFVLDDGRWITDPAAPLAPEDGFGTRNSVVMVGGET
jgi:hypothetical protein